MTIANLTRKNLDGSFSTPLDPAIREQEDALAGAIDAIKDAQQTTDAGAQVGAVAKLKKYAAAHPSEVTDLRKADQRLRGEIADLDSRITSAVGDPEGRYRCEELGRQRAALVIKLTPVAEFLAVVDAPLMKTSDDRPLGDQIKQAVQSSVQQTLRKYFPTAI